MPAGSSLTVPGAAPDLASISAKVVRINPSAQTGSRTVAVYMAVQTATKNASENNSSQRAAQLRPGLFLQGSIITGSTNQLAVPLSAVRTDKPQPYVQVLQASGTAPAKPNTLRVVHKTVQLGVQTSHQGASWVQIASGLSAGDRVLAGSAGGLREGTLVEVQVPQATANSASKTEGQ